MEKKLTLDHFCYYIFNEMTLESFQSFLDINCGGKNLKYLEIDKNKELYEDAKKQIMAHPFDFVKIEFPLEEFPYVFEKFIDGKFDRTYKICIFEITEEERIPLIKTSDVYCNGEPLFFDEDNNLIKPSNN
jgi:hypothetical protein